MVGVTSNEGFSSLIFLTLTANLSDALAGVLER